MKSQDLTFYHVHDAELLEDGVLRVRTGGSTGDCLFNGVYDVAPDNPEYRFWLWLRERRKRRWYQFGPINGLLDDEIKKLREEFDHECA